MARVNVRNAFKNIKRAVENFVKGGALDRLSGEVLDFIQTRWTEYIDDPDLGFGTDSNPGKPGQINYTGASRRGIIVFRDGHRRLDIQERHPNLQRIRHGTKATGKFDRKVYVWGWTKILGFEGEPPAERAKKGSELAVRKALARKLALSVMFKGTSSEYERTRYHNDSYPRGFDYPGQFLFLYDKEIARDTERVGLRMAQQLGRTIVRFTRSSTPA